MTLAKESIRSYSVSMASQQTVSSVGDREKKILEKLRSDARKGRWAEVCETYEKEKALRAAKITVTGDTVLHIAVSSGVETVVAYMVDLFDSDVVVTVDGDGPERSDTVVIYGSENERGNTPPPSSDVKVVLGAENGRGNTPLHLAALMGNVGMCKKIGRADPSLISRRNVEGETPLFLAALYGKRKAFLWLYYISKNNPGFSLPNYENWKRKNNDTILHCAIAEGHFDVAIEIVLLYEDLVKRLWINDEGLSPLHLLAAMPSAFHSNTRLAGPFGYLAYYCLRVKEKKHATTLEELEGEYNLGDAVVKCVGDIKRTENKMFKKFINPVLQPLLEFSKAVNYVLNMVREWRETYPWSLQIMEKLLMNASDSDMSARSPSEKPSTSSEKQEDKGKLGVCGCKHPYSPHCRCVPVCGPVGRIETLLMIAARNGVIEMVKRIVELFPSTICDVDDEGKNIVLLAAENRQTKVYQFLCQDKILNESLFRQVDKEGNSALHLAANFGDERNWDFLGEVLPMHWEIKWFEYVRRSMPPGVFARDNNNLKTPDDIFRDTHENLERRQIEWLSQTSEACSLVSTLVATVTFATMASLPGGFDQNKGFPLLRGDPTFDNWFAGSSFCAFLFSLLSTLLFVSLVTCRHQAPNFLREVPVVLSTGLLCMFTSIAFMWVSFCAGHSFLHLEQNRRKYTYFYIVSSIPLTLYAIFRFPAFFNLLTSNFTSWVPPPSHSSPAIIKYRRTKTKKGCTDENDQN